MDLNHPMGMSARTPHIGEDIDMYIISPKITTNNPQSYVKFFLKILVSSTSFFCKPLNKYELILTVFITESLNCTVSQKNGTLLN
jgi:hypothetical protein